jgi:hypothetical protein
MDGIQFSGRKHFLRSCVRFCLVGTLLFNSACNEAVQKVGAIDAVNIALTTQDCGSALQQILPFYNSAASDNSVRMAMAATYGCYSGIRLLTVIDDLLNFSGEIGGSGFWEFLADEFPSITTPDDRKPQAAAAGIDATLATLKPGAFLVSSTTVNITTPNPGSLLAIDRIDDANAYLTFLAMALLGTMENRFSLPTSDNHQSQDLPWTTYDKTKGDGCNFASGLLNFYDGITFLKEAAPDNISAVYEKIQSFLGSALDQACSAGCTFCNSSVSCTACPTSLRNRDSCTGESTDVNSCAASGLVLFVNASWLGPDL